MERVTLRTDLARYSYRTILGRRDTRKDHRSDELVHVYIFHMHEGQRLGQGEDRFTPGHANSVAFFDDIQKRHGCYSADLMQNLRAIFMRSKCIGNIDVLETIFFAQNSRECDFGELLPVHMDFNDPCVLRFSRHVDNGHARDLKPFCDIALCQTLAIIKQRNIA